MLLHAELHERNKGICKLCHNMHLYAFECTYMLPLQFQRDTCYYHYVTVWSL